MINGIQKQNNEKMTINKAIEKILLEQLKKFQTDNNRMTIVGRVKN